MWIASRSCAGVSGAVVVVIVGWLVIESSPALTHIGLARFFSDSSWHPAPDAPAGSFNWVPMIIGSLLATVGAVLVAGPMGLLSAVFMHYYAPPLLASGYRRAIELLGGVPSVVYGFWGLVVLVPMIRQLQPPGPSLLAGVVILSIMILPTAALTCDAALAGVPGSLLHGAAALGLSRWTTLRGVVWPVVKSAVSTGVILQAGRAIGETMAILMVCGNIVQVPTSVFDPVRTLTANIALEMAYAVGDHRSALFLCGLMLMGVVTGLILAAQFVSGRGRGHG